jgi:hypothetical protein
MNQRLSSAASLAKELAENLDQNYDYEEAIKFYEKAAELYILDNTPTSGNSLLIKASDLRILTRDYEKSLPIAIQNYDRIGRKYLT